MTGAPAPKPPPAAAKSRKPMRQASPAQQRVRRTRADRASRAPATSCPRCHHEPAVDTHEKVRRSQSGDAALDVFVQVPLGRTCHDWVTQHPEEAHAEGWVLWRWEYDQQNQARELAEQPPAPAETPTAEPDDRVPITLRLPRSLVESIDKRAGTHKMSRNTWSEFALQRVVEMPGQVTRGGTRRF